MEWVRNLDGIDFINDSKATNVNSTWYALESMTKPIVLIAGGVDKGNDYQTLAPLVEDKVRILICLGKNNIKLHQAFAKHVDMIINTESAREAVQKSLCIPTTTAWTLSEPVLVCAVAVFKQL